MLDLHKLLSENELKALLSLLKKYPELAKKLKERLQPYIEDKEWLLSFNIQVRLNVVKEKVFFVVADFLKKRLQEFLKSKLTGEVEFFSTYIDKDAEPPWQSLKYCQVDVTPDEIIQYLSQFVPETMLDYTIERAYYINTGCCNSFVSYVVIRFFPAKLKEVEPEYWYHSAKPLITLYRERVVDFDEDEYYDSYYIRC